MDKPENYRRYAEFKTVPVVNDAEDDVVIKKESSANKKERKCGSEC